MMHDNDDYKRDIRAVTPPAEGPVPEPGRHYGHVRRPSRFWLFMLSPLPGLGHMYLGLIRRGLFYVSALALLVFLTTTLAPSFLVILTGFSMAALFAVAFFETLVIRRDILMGKEVKDVVPNIGFLVKNKSLMAIVVVIMIVALGINIITSLRWYAWVVIGIVAVVYFGRRPK